MELFLLIGRLVLAVVFAVAGTAKLFDRAGSERAIVDFGLPESSAKPLAVLLPIAEVAAAILLLPLATAWAGAILSLVLLVGFVCGIVYNLARGKAPDCHCFGQIHSEPVGWSVLIRNLVLVGIAVFIVLFGRGTAGTSAFAWLENLSGGERMQLVFNLVFVGLLAALVVSLRKVLTNQIVLQRQIEILELTANESGGGKREVERKDVRKPGAGLPVGAIAPDFAAADQNGRQITVEHLMMRQTAILMFFVSPTCQPCQALVPKIAEWQTEFGARLIIVFASSGAAAENKQKFAQMPGEPVILLQKEREIAELFRAAWTPGAVLINHDGTIGSALATGDREIFDLIDNFRKAGEVSANGNGNRAHKFLLPKNSNPRARIGATVPQFVLPSLDGRTISSDEFRGKKTFLLFWRATCPYCRSMIDDLKNWEALDSSEFKLVVVAAKEPEIEAARQFKSAVLIESNAEVQRLFDHDGTPGALIIDETGKIASDIAVGADDVFALVGYAPTSKV